MSIGLYEQSCKCVLLIFQGQQLRARMDFDSCQSGETSASNPSSLSQCLQSADLQNSRANALTLLIHQNSPLDAAQPIVKEEGQPFIISGPFHQPSARGMQPMGPGSVFRFRALPLTCDCWASASSSQGWSKSCSPRMVTVQMRTKACVEHLPLSNTWWVLMNGG